MRKIEGAIRGIQETLRRIPLVARDRLKVGADPAEVEAWATAQRAKLTADLATLQQHDSGHAVTPDTRGSTSSQGAQAQAKAATPVRPPQPTVAATLPADDDGARLLITAVERANKRRRARALLY